MRVIQFSLLYVVGVSMGSSMDFTLTLLQLILNVACQPKILPVLHHSAFFYFFEIIDNILISYKLMFRLSQC